MRTLALVIVMTASLAIPLGRAAEAPYLKRGHEVDERYHAYTAKLAQGYELLKTRLRHDAPDLYRELNPAPPKPVPYGYQLVPKLTRDAAPGEQRATPRAVSTPYSWARTEAFISWQVPKVEEMIEQLTAVTKVALKDRRQIYERWIKEYRELEDSQRLLDLHLQYNHFWQQAIAEDRPHFERLTKLHDLVLQHQAVLDALSARTDADWTRALHQLGGLKLDLTRPRAVLEPELGKLERQMTEVIHSDNERIKAPAFLKLSHPRPTVWEVHVPVYTDIADEAFLKNAKEVIERLWSLDERENSYRMRLEYRRISAATLYHPGKPPRRGDHLDVRRHAARFPKDGAVLTTGTNSTYAIPGQYVALGSQPISHNVLAHEFGHLLGFVDGYFRGFHDLGAEGFEVVEVVPDPADIMCTPGAGHVESFHYRALFRAGAPKNK